MNMNRIYSAVLILIGVPLSVVVHGQIIADHTVVDLYDDIPQQWIDSVKTMHFIPAGESHSNAYLEGLVDLEVLDPTYQVDWDGVGDPAPYTDTRLRIDRIMWGDYDNASGWVREFGDEDWFTNSTGISRTKASITYMYENGWEISALGLVWCWDMTGDATIGTDPVYGCRWFGSILHSPDGAYPWGLDSEDYAITGNSVSMDTYLSATQEYSDYCVANGYDTKIFFATGPLDSGSDEAFYQVFLKHEHIRDYVKADPTRILFDYADILTHDNDGTQTTMSWNGHTFPAITATNLIPEQVGHISDAGALRLGKAIWWMLARIAGWDGSTGPDIEEPSIPDGLSVTSVSETSVSFSWNASSDNVGVSGYNIYRGGSLLESVSEVNYTDYSITGCDALSYTVSAYDQAGNESSQSETLIVNPCLPDVTPTITLNPNVANGVTIFELILRVTELNNRNTSGNIVIHIPKDQHWDLAESYNPSLTDLGETSLNNSEWSYSFDDSNHIFTSSTTITGGSYSTFGFRISFDPGSSTGVNPITTQLVSGGGGEVHISNNSDSEQLDYFQ